MTQAVTRMVPVDRLLSELTRQELKLKLAGAYAESAGIRYAVTSLLRLADQGEASLDPSETPL